MSVGARLRLNPPNERKPSVRDGVNNRQLKLAMGTFRVEFAALEYSWGWVLALLTNNMGLVEPLFALLEFEKRLKLIQWLADDQRLPLLLLEDLTAARVRSRRLMEHREKLRASRLCTLPEVQRYTREALVLQGFMQGLNDKLLEYAREVRP